MCQLVGLMLCLSGALVAAPGPRELLPNPGFEADAPVTGRPSGWTVLEGSVSLTAEKVRSGKRALECQDAGANASVSVDSVHVPCDTSRFYLARAWLRAEGKARPSFYLQFFDDAGIRIGVIASFAPASTDWVSVSLGAMPPKAARSVSVLIFSGAAEEGKFQADDVSLLAWDVADMGGKGGILPNPGFETSDARGGGPEGWVKSTGEIVLVDADRHGGLKALRLPCQTGSQGVASSVRSMWFPVKPFETWRLSGWLKQQPGTTALLDIEFVDGFLNPLQVKRATVTKLGEWAEASVQASVPTGASGMMVRLSAVASTATLGGKKPMHVLADDLNLRRVPREGPEVLDIGTQRQLFVDDYLLEEIESVERVFHPARKDPEPAIVADRPWEERSFLGVLGNCVFHDEADGLYKMYYIIYQVIGQGGERQHYALATSRDGLRWEKPKLGVAHYKGSVENNLLWDYESARYAREFWAYNNVIRDARDPDPARRYKALGMWLRYGKDAGYDGYGMLVAFSPDGVHWSEPRGIPVLPNGDTHTLLGWDDRIGKYVAYPRTGTTTRNIGYSTSDDFLRWAPAKTVLEPRPGDPSHYEIYGMPVVKYQGLYIGLPWAFLAADLEPLDTQLAVSRDGIRWQKVANGQMFIPRGRAGSFDDGYAVSANPIVVGDEILFYYMGCGFPHGPRFFRESKREGCIGRARLRLDGFVSLASLADSGGTILTRPVRFNGSRMVVNCSCQRGWLRIELQDSDGNRIPGYAESDCDPIRTDAVRQRVTWRGRDDVGPLAGKPLRVRLRIGDGEVFSFGFVE